MRKGNTMKFKELRQDVIHQVKSLKEYSLVDKKLPRIYCDMDGVLCNFERSAERAVGMPLSQC